MVAAATALLASLAPGLTMTGAGPVCGVASRTHRRHSRQPRQPRHTSHTRHHRSSQRPQQRTPQKGNNTKQIPNNPLDNYVYNARNGIQ